MTTPIQRTNLLWSGDNPIITLKPAQDARESTVACFYRVDFSPLGSGIVVFIICDLGGQGHVHDRVAACYTDRPDLAEWMRDTVASTLPELKNYDLNELPIKRGRFAWIGDTRRSWTELISTEDGEVRLTWGELQQPFNLQLPIGSVPSVPYEINTVIIPSRKAEVAIDGRVAAGQAFFPVASGEQPDSSAFLAVSETWYLPA